MVRCDFYGICSLGIRLIFHNMPIIEKASREVSVMSCGSTCFSHIGLKGVCFPVGI